MAVVKIIKPDSHKPQHFCSILVRVEAHFLGKCDIIVTKWKIICVLKEVDEPQIRLKGKVS